MKTSVARVMKNGQHKYSIAVYLKHFCTSSPQRQLMSICSTDDILVKKLQSALLSCKDDEVWGVFRKFKSLHGSPPPSAITRLICGFSYSLDNRSLPRACHIVFKIAKENSALLERDTMSKLCLSLARAQMSLPAAKILRLTLMKNITPTMDVLCSVFMHMVKTDAGTHLASNILLEFCDHFRRVRAEKSECAMSMKPSTTIFNIVLEACTRVGSSLKGEQIIAAMARTGVVADLRSLLLFTCIYEMNGQRDELKKFNKLVDRVSVPLAQHYYLFYDKLLRLHFKFDDLNSAVSLIEDIYFHWDSHPLQQNKDLLKPYLIPIGSTYLIEGLKIQVVFEGLQKDSLFHVKGEEDLVIFQNGNINLTSRGLAQLIAKYKRSDRVHDLSKLLAAIEKQRGTSQDGSISCDVIQACIYSGFLETAHDILDDMEIANVPVPTSTYMLLLIAYCREKMPKEALAMAKQIKRMCLLVDASDEMIISKCLLGVGHISSVSMIAPTSIRQAELIIYLVEEMRKKDNALSRVYELNSSIYFFCKAKMLEDARKIYRKMQEISIQPTVQTFAYLIQGYLSLEDYREVTILWGDIKRYMARGCSLRHRDLYELLLMSFLRGGYFERVLEVIVQMKEHGIYADRWLYKHEFLRLHNNLYRRLRATDGTTEAQRLRIEHVRAFRMWVRNN